VVIDAITNHSALTLDDFKQIFAAGGRQPKEIAKYLGKLREGGLISVHGRQETKPGAQKTSTVEYWWIDYQRAIDATKYRLHMLQEHLSHLGKSTTEKKDYTCRTCGSEWTQMEVLDNPDPEHRGSGFLCKRCNSLLDYKPQNSQDGRPEDDNIVSQFNTQLGHILALVETIDKLVVPVTTPESAIENIKPVPKQKEVGGIDTEPLDNLMTRAQPSSVKGLKMAEKVEIVLTTDSENTAAAQQAEADRRARISAQNRLPEWHTKSTVSGDATRVGHNESLGDLDSLAPITGENGEKKPVLNNEAFDRFFETLEAERAQAAQGQDVEEDEEEEESDEDEDEFEDVTSPILKRPKIEEQTFSPAAIVDSNAIKGPEPIATPLPDEDVGEDDDSEEEEFEEVV
jgi:transcription initiation factor TFIIE subunit alpha